MGLGNEILFEIRRRLPAIRKKPYQERLDSASWSLMGEGRLSLSQAGALSRTSLIQNLIYGEALENVPFEFEESRPLRALDLGSRQFVYAPALARWLESQSSSGAVELTGLEVDTRSYYWDFYQRRDLARYYAQIASTPAVKVSYQEGEWLTYQTRQSYDLITCFFPYLFGDLHRKDRLPPSAFNPRLFYKKIMMNAPAFILFHQGQVEFEVSKELLGEFPEVSILKHFSLQNTAYGTRKSRLYGIYAWVHGGIKPA